MNKERLYFYYTSDLHNHFENWPQIVGYFQEKKRSMTEGRKITGCLTTGIT